jgi:hypothetical protein
MANSALHVCTSDRHSALASNNVRNYIKYLTLFQHAVMNAIQVAMKKLPQTILAAARALPEGGVLSPREFLHLGNRAAIDQALSRLAKSGELMRIGRGLYAAPVASRFGMRAPSPEKVVQELEHRTGEVLVPHGAIEANRLGLTQQVPIRDIYLSSGPKRRLQFGKAEMLVEHVSPKSIALGKRPAGAAARAVVWLGPKNASWSLRKVHEALSFEEWHVLTNARRTFPSWMARAIGQEMMRV